VDVSRVLAADRACLKSRYVSPSRKAPGRCEEVAPQRHDRRVSDPSQEILREPFFAEFILRRVEGLKG
jgi:hypothetical protein